MIFNLLNMHFKLKHDIRHVTCHMTYNCTIDKNKMDSILHIKTEIGGQILEVLSYSFVLFICL